MLSIEDFIKLDIRVGTIIRAEPSLGSKKPAMKVWVNFGPDIGEKKSSAQITGHYSEKDLIGLQVAAVINLRPRQIGKFMSEILILGFPDGDGEVVLIHPGKKIPNGGKLY
mgnify:CR=1 FL=1